MLLHMDQSLAAVSGLDADEATRHALIRALDTFRLGDVVAEISGA
jgi:hypothetical protein